MRQTFWRLMLTFYNHTNSDVISIFVHDGVNCSTLPRNCTSITDMLTHHHDCFLISGSV